MSTALDLAQKKVSSALETIPDAAVAWMAETSNWKKRKWPLTFPMPVPALHPLIGSNVVFDEFWTHADETGLSQWWAQEKLSWTYNYQDLYRQLWVRCLLYLQCTPYDIVGVKGNLVSERSIKGPRPTDDSSSLWPRDFCSDLTDLVTHHAWKCGTEGGAKRKLIMALQYAVILRTNDQRVWKIDELDYDLLKDFKQVIQDQSTKGPVPIRQLHKEACKRFQRRAVRPRCSLSEGFSSLEKVVKSANNPLHNATTQPFGLRKEDIANLAKALDGAINSDNGMALYIPPKVIATCVSLPSIRNGLPKYEDLDRWHEVSIKDQQRQMKRRERMAPEAMEIDDTPEGFDGTQGGEQQREEQLQQGEQQLQQQQQQLQQLQQRLQQRDREQDLREQHLDVRDRQLREREQEGEQQREEEQRERQEQNVQQREQQLNQQEELLYQREQLLHQREQQLRQREQQL